ncbi:MAG: type II toxin-antitoxin system Phd/YefM family antitoxin [Halioglobus sp.]|nr:type II toxin-antitoxin system Phd/YefM family antitoxin [Halioglobus sp.]
MKKVSATEASKAFGQLVDDVQSESVTIERNGRPVAVVYSYDEAQRIEAMREAHLDVLIQEGINAADEGRIRPLTQNVKDEILTNARQRYEELSQ